MLIAIVASVAIFIGNWYVNLAKENTQTVESQMNTALTCNDVSLNYRNVVFNESGNGYLKFYLENTGGRDVVITLIRVTSSTGAYQDFNESFTLTAGNERLVSLQVDTNNIKDIDSIRVVPSTCSNKAITIEKDYITTYP